jgi:hypothetical protein
MTSIRARRALGVEPLGLLIRLSRGVRPTSLVAPGVTRWALYEIPVAVGHDPGGGSRAQSLPTGRNRARQCPSTPV